MERTKPDSEGEWMMRPPANASLVILAAGMGSRYGGLKQIEPVGPNGEWLIEYSVYDALAVGFQRIVFVVQRDQKRAFQDLFKEKLSDRCRVEFAEQLIADVPLSPAIDRVGRTKPWGTGHAVLAARRCVTGAFAVINADDFYGRGSYAALTRFLTATADGSPACALVGFDLLQTLSATGPVSRGVCDVSDDGTLIRIVERTNVHRSNEGLVYTDLQGASHPLAVDAIASMNMWAFPMGFMQQLGDQFVRFLSSADADHEQNEFYLPGAVDALRESERVSVRVLPTSERWMGVTHREDLASVRRGVQDLVQRGVYPKDLWRD